MGTNVDCVNQDASDDTLEIKACNERNQGTELAVVYYILKVTPFITTFAWHWLFFFF